MFKANKIILILAMLLSIVIACSEEAKQSAKLQKEQAMKMKLTIKGKVLTATLYENSSVKALLKLLEKGDVTIDMHDYSNFEKVGELPITLPRNDTPTNTDSGDIILYQGKQFVIYYDKNSWNFTPLGKLGDISKKDLKALLGSGNVTVVLSIL
ncbi:MAG: cyclophilin-like fold protein [Treponema sp.]